MEKFCPFDPTKLRDLLATLGHAILVAFCLVLTTHIKDSHNRVLLNNNSSFIYCLFILFCLLPWCSVVQILSMVILKQTCHVYYKYCVHTFKCILLKYEIISKLVYVNVQYIPPSCICIRSYNCDKSQQKGTFVYF